MITSAYSILVGSREIIFLIVLFVIVSVSVSTGFSRRTVRGVSTTSTGLSMSVESEQCTWCGVLFLPPSQGFLKWRVER